MDYFDLLHQAQVNNKNVSVQDTRCYKTSFAAPKKSEKRVSSDNIKKFLARKEEEERRKLQEAKKKKDELLALRALDKKSQKRVQVMLKRTKSANKSVMEDAIDNYNTKDTLEGPQQCDEDDYGYVSQEASAFYEKLMAKYEKEPIEKVSQMSREVKDLKAAKERVKAALDKEAEELLHPTRKRKRKHEDGEDVNEEEKEEPKNGSKPEREPVKEEVKEKPKKTPKKMPPPVDFFELMKIAAKKQHEPIMIEKKVEEPERPMTMKEKLERQREQERINRRNNPKKPPEPTKPQKSKPEEPPKQNPKKTDVLSLPSFKKKQVKFNVEKPSNDISTSKEKISDKPRSQVNTAPKIVKKEDTPVEDVSDIDKEIALLMKKKKMLMEAKAKASQKPSPQSSKDSLKNPKLPGKSSSLPMSKPVADDRNRSEDRNRLGKDRPKSGDGERPILKNLLEKDKAPKSADRGIDKGSKPVGKPEKKFSPPRYGPPARPPPKKKLQRRVIDSESDYDSEMDDFIDDGPEEGMDYSKHIKEIFGYDKSRYADIDEDECMESSFLSQMKEEQRSAKIGLMEDLEDIQREKMEKARLKKKMMRR